MLSSERPLTKAKAPDNSRDRSSSARSRSRGTLTRSGVRARSSKVPSISRKRAVFPLTGGIIQGFPSQVPAFRNGKIKWASIQWDRNAQMAQRVPRDLASGLVTGPGKGPALHAGIIGNDGHITG